MVQTQELQDDHLAGPRVSGTGKKSFMVYSVEALATGPQTIVYSKVIQFIPFGAALTPDQNMTEPDSAE